MTHLPPLPPPERFNFAAHVIARNAGRGEKVAYVDDEGSLTYGALAERIGRFAAALGALGVRREERILLLMHDCNDWPVAFLGALYAGVVPVAVNTLLVAKDYAYMLEHSRARVAFVSAPLLDTLRDAMNEARHECTAVVVSGANAAPGTTAFEEFVGGSEPLAAAAPTGCDDPAFWLYSSGSTGRPKGAVHTHANPYWTAELYGSTVLEICESDVCFSAAKLFFAYGLGNALTFPLCAGATVVLMAGRATPDEVFRRIVDRRVTVFFGAPTGFAGMLASPALPASADVALRLASSAGEALPAEIGRRFTAHFGVEIIDGIGSTEMLHIYCSNRPGSVSYGTTGRPVPGYTIELRGEDGLPVADGEAGDLFVQGPSSAIMYWGDRERSRQTFVGAWTKSGDKYVRNADGTFTFAGRTDDMIKVSGVYVSPFEVEGVLVEHPAVLEAAVIGVKDAEELMKTKAFVVLKPDRHATAAELQQFVKDRLAPFKYPRSIVFLDALPKTATGKIQRFRLREQSVAAT